MSDDTEGAKLLDDLHNGYTWECFNPGWTEEQMRVRYAQKHGGAEPRHIVRCYGMCWVGPVEGER